MHRGTIKNWDDTKGFGFINTPELNQDIFIHISTLKHMSRKPLVGDVLLFEIAHVDGKTRAVNAHIEGVKPLDSSPRPSLSKGRKIRKPRGGNPLFRFIYVPIAILVVVFIVQRIHVRHELTPAVQTTEVSSYQAISIPEPLNNSQIFTCDGRQYCGQMTSRAEANFFIRNCPNTKMDGDGDGEPCERDARF